MTTPDDPRSEPELADFLAPITPRKSRRVLISVVSAVTVVAMIAVAFAFAFSALGGGSGDAASSAQSGEGQSPNGRAVQGPIADAAVRYITAVNAGVAADYLDAICPPARGGFEDLQDKAPANPQMLIRSVSDVRVDGEIATARVTIVEEGRPNAVPRTDTLRFLDDEGWKYCGVAG